MNRHNVTVALPDELARWARARAAEQDISVSRLLERLLGREMGDDLSYESAMRTFLRRKPSRISDGGAYPTRDSL